MRISAVQHQRARTLRVAGGEQNGYGGSVRRPEQCGPSAAGRIHDGVQIIHVCLEARRLGAIAPIAQSGAALVEQDQAAEGCKPVQEMTEASLLPMDL
jgi:hypothetical protein